MTVWGQNLFIRVNFDRLWPEWNENPDIHALDLSGLTNINWAASKCLAAPDTVDLLKPSADALRICGRRPSFEKVYLKPWV
jgi:hypothetical protein